LVAGSSSASADLEAVVDPRFTRACAHELIAEAHRAGLEVVPMLDMTDRSSGEAGGGDRPRARDAHAIDGVAIEAQGEPATLAARFGAWKGELKKIDPCAKLVAAGPVDAMKGAHDC
jgi:hypothetical protein